MPGREQAQDTVVLQAALHPHVRQPRAKTFPTTLSPCPLGDPREGQSPGCRCLLPLLLLCDPSDRGSMEGLENPGDRLFLGKQPGTPLAPQEAWGWTEAHRFSRLTAHSTQQRGKRAGFQTSNSVSAHPRPQSSTQKSKICITILPPFFFFLVTESQKSRRQG